MTEVDLIRDSDHDLLNEQFQEKCFELAAASDVVFATPPCNTHSRAPWSNQWGPVPIRNALYPLGFPWLSSALARKAEAANSLVTFSIDCMKLVAQKSKTQFAWA